MKPSKLFLPMLLVVIALAACAPQPAATEAVQLLPLPQESVATQDPSGLTVESAPATQVAVPESALPVATSRGDQLEATDPATVSLASGGIQLVEFFRFT